jgi:hypothetical protein
MLDFAARHGIEPVTEIYEKVGYNPKEQLAVTTVRRRIKTDRELLMKEEYRGFIEQILDRSETSLPPKENV